MEGSPDEGRRVTLVQPCCGGCWVRRTKAMKHARRMGLALLILGSVVWPVNNLVFGHPGFANGPDKSTVGLIGSLVVLLLVGFGAWLESRGQDEG